MSVAGKIRQLIGDPRLFTRFKKINITAAEVLLLRATPKTLIAAQGSTRVIQLLTSLLEIVPGATAYTETTDNLAVRYTNTTGVIVSQTVEMTGFITLTARSFTSVQPLVDGIVAGTASLNRALVLHNTGGGEFANAGNGTLTLHLTYRVWDVG